MKQVLLRWVTLLCLLGVTAAAGCQSTGDGSAKSKKPGDSGSTVPITAHAVLDTASAAITMPIQAYGMTPRQQQLAKVAASIVYARCVTGQREVSPAVLQTARTSLDSPSGNGPEWLYGYWNAQYIAAHGWQVSGSKAPLLMQTDNRDTMQRCTNDDAYLAVQPVSTTDVTGNMEHAALIRYSRESNDKALRDPRYVRLKADFATCVGKKGYTADKDTEAASIRSDASWGPEETTKAALAEATCNDELRLTQQAGDIAASHEQEYITAHEAELTTIKRIADQHAAKAQEILREVGLV